MGIRFPAARSEGLWGKWGSIRCLRMFVAADYSPSGHQGRIFRRNPPLEHGSHRRTGLDPEPIIDGTPQFLFASQVAFRRLNRNVPQEELDLIEFAAGQMT